MRPETFEDILVGMHTGQWFMWTDSKNKDYANQSLTPKMGVEGMLDDNPHKLPTEKELTDALAKQQSDFDALDFSRKRASEYPSIPDQLDEIYHNGIDSWKAIIKQTKDKYPKG